MSVAAVAPKLVAATLQVPIVVEPCSGGWYAHSQYLPGLHIDADTPEEALGRAIRAAGLYLESVARHGDPLPAPIKDFEMAADAEVHTVTFEWPTPLTSGIK